MCPERGPQLDEAGRPTLFSYRDGCECCTCHAARAMRDSLDRMLFANAVKVLHDYECWLLVADSLDEMVKIQYGMADMRQAIFEGLQNWEGPAAVPRMVH